MVLSLAGAILGTSGARARPRKGTARPDRTGLRRKLFARRTGRVRQTCSTLLAGSATAVFPVTKPTGRQNLRLSRDPPRQRHRGRNSGTFRAELRGLYRPLRPPLRDAAARP